MNSTSKKQTTFTTERWVAIIGLLVYIVLGFSGSAFTGNMQNLLFAGSSVPFVAGTICAATIYLRRNQGAIAGGFIVLAIAESMLLTSGLPSAAASGYDTGFAGGALYYVPGLLLISLPKVMPGWVRILGTLAAIPWTVFAIQNLTGGQPSFVGPVAIVGYSLLSLAAIGWVITLWRNREIQ